MRFIAVKRGLHPMLKYRRFSKQKNFYTDGSIKIKKIPKCTELSYLGKSRFLFFKKNFIFVKKNKIKNLKIEYVPVKNL